MSDVDTLPTLANVGGALERMELGTPFGRYIILDVQGRGGMGVVYSAYDPKLDRRVALKLLGPSGNHAAENSARLLREAQALAKLAHPNVVTVHDSGVIGDVVFVEMELVEGTQLGEWSRDRSWRDVLGAFAQAGRALAAVHGVGLIHRDFKPSNVIVDKDERVRLLDFGIARAGSRDGLDDDAAAPPTVPLPLTDEAEVRVSRSSAVTLPATMLGTASGTPAFMAPEQWKGRELDARADQYSFAAALFKTFYGKLPFGEAAPAKMIDERSRGPLIDRPASTGVPMYVHRALVRALAFDAKDRFGSMGELLDALTIDPGGTRRKGLTLAAIALLLVGIAVLGVRRDRARAAGACAGMSEKLAGAWDDDKIRRVHDTLEKSGNPASEDVWGRTKRLLDAYANDWVQMRTRACEASQHGAGKVEDEALGARLVCLDWRLRELRGLTDVLASDTGTIHGSLDAATGLIPVAECERAGVREAVRPFEDPAIRARVDAVRSKLAEADAQRLAGRPKAAVPIARAAVEDARSAGARPAEGLALLALGRAQVADGDYKAAAATLEQAAWTAEASHDDPTLAGATTDLVLVTGFRNGDTVAAARWEKHALAAVDRIGGPDAFVAELDTNRGAMARTRLELDAALALGDDALQRSLRAYGPAHPQVARAEHNLANVFVAMARYDDAMVHYERSRELSEKALGPAHPLVALALLSEGGLLRKRGEVDKALAQYARARDILVASLGPDHPDVGILYANMGTSLMAEGRLDEARASFERSLAIKRKVFGEKSTNVASSLVSLAVVDLNELKYAASREKLTRALAIDEAIVGKESPSLCGSLLELATLDLREGKPADALERSTRCLDVRVKKLGHDHHDTATALTRVGVSHLALGHAALALPMLEHAATLLEKDRSSSSADAQFAVARALRATSGNAARARALTTAAAEQYTKEGLQSKYELDTLRAWMATNERWLASSASSASSAVKE